MMTVCLSLFVMSAASSRPTMSVLPPGAQGMMIRIGFAGHDWIEDPDHVNHGAYRAIREFCSGHGWTVTRRDRFTQWELARER